MLHGIVGMPPCRFPSAKWYSRCRTVRRQGIVKSASPLGLRARGRTKTCTLATHSPSTSPRHHDCGL